uniref:C2H2-type domain-containing protein n=1 Tax=Pygocentrus nattereri TaxID=42514 RepID=A0A3B4CW89_PYGNA
MEKQEFSRSSGPGSRLPLSSLRLLVPPLHLMYTFMWQILLQRNVQHYGKLEEFVSLVTETVPHLLNYRQRAQLLLGLRARMVLEALRGSSDTKTIHAHLERMRLPTIPTGAPVHIDSDLELSVSNFKALVLALLKDPAEKACFFQVVFPVEYGPKYDTALKELMWELLFCLERLFPVPDFKKTLSWLTPAPAGLDECMQSEPKWLQALLQQHEVIGSGDKENWRTTLSTSGNCILSSLSIPPSTHVAVATEPMVYHIQPTTVTILSQNALGQLGTEAIIVTDYTEVELSSNEVAEITEVSHNNTEESVRKCVEQDKESSSMLAILSDEVAGEEEEITVSQQVELREEPQDRNGEARNFCEKSTQCDIIMEILGDGGGLVSIRAEPERENKGEQKQEDVAQASDDGQEDSGQCNCTLEEDESMSIEGGEQTVQPRRRRGRPRKNAAPPKEVQSGRRRGRPPSVTVENATETKKNEDGEKKVAKPSKLEAGQNGGQTTVKTRGLRTRLEPQPEASENPRARYTCNVCGRKFTRSSDVRRHQLTHTGERPFRCTQCEKTFQHSWDLTKHCKKFHGEATFSCQLCCKSFVNLRALTAHHKESHTEQLPLYCSICGEVSPSSSALIEHRRMHSATHQYKCDECGEGFDTLLQRSAHRESHRMHRKFKCPQCDKAYTRRADVKRHQLTHTGERPHQCGICGKGFALRAGLQKHQRIHTGERPFQCSQCPKAFSLMSILHRHERMHTGERPFLCSQCGKSFLSLGELLKHDKSHTNEKPHCCTQCKKTFKSKRGLKDHMLRHSGLRPHACSYCGKKFTKSFALIRHHMMHTGERPFSCTYCDKTFLTSTEMSLHQRMHTGERPFSCSECPWKFRTSSELTRHKRTHSQEKVYDCNCCPKTYKSLAKLKSHIRIHAAFDRARCLTDGEVAKIDPDDSASHCKTQ